MRRRVQVTVALFLSLLLLPIAPAVHTASAARSVASTPEFLPAQVVHAADLVVNATVISDFVIQIDAMPHTVVMLAIDDHLKGDSASVVPVLVAGGPALDGRYVSVSHTPEFRLGRQVQAALVASSQTSLSATLMRLGEIESALYEVPAGEQGVVETSLNAFEATAAGADDFVIFPAQKWATFSTPASYVVNPQGSGVSTARTLAAINRAAQAWEDDPGSVVDFEYAGPTTKRGKNPGDGDNVISFQFLPSENVVALTSWLPKSDGTFEFDIVLNTRFAFADGAAAGRYDIEMMVTHELGHVLGLGHPAQSGASQEVMFKTAFQGITKGLGAGDRAGIRRLYAPAPVSSSCPDLVVTVDLNTGVGSPTEGADVILGTPGPDWIWALGGDDIICGGGGIDRIFAGDGHDQIFGGGGSDRIWGEAGDDVIHAGSGADRVWAGDGNDKVYGQGGQDFLFGEAGDDELQGNWQSDLLSGGDGNDDLRGAGGKDLIYGDAGDDSLFGGLNTDYLNGGSGVDAGDGQRGRDNPVLPGVSGCEQLEATTSC